MQVRWPTPIYTKGGQVLSREGLEWLGSLVQAHPERTQHAQHTGPWVARGMGRYLVNHLRCEAGERRKEGQRCASVYAELVQGIEREAERMLRALGQHPFMTRYNRLTDSLSGRQVSVRLCTLEFHWVLKGGHYVPSFSAGESRAKRGGGPGGKQGDSPQGKPPAANASGHWGSSAAGSCPRGLSHFVGFLFVTGNDHAQEAGRGSGHAERSDLPPHGTLLSPLIMSSCRRPMHCFVDDASESRSAPDGRAYLSSLTKARAWSRA